MNEENTYDVVDRNGHILQRTQQEILSVENRALLDFDSAMEAGVLGIHEFNTNYGHFKFYHRHETSDLSNITHNMCKGLMSGEIMKHIDIPAYRFLMEYECMWIDGGCHLGTVAIRFAKQFKHYSVMIEGFEPTLSIALENVKLNDCEEYIESVHGGIVGYNDPRIENDRITFYCLGNTAAGNTVMPIRGRFKFTAPSIHLSDLVDSFNANCIKLDVEGAEQGEHGILSDSGDVWERVDLLLLEYHISYNGWDKDLYYDHMENLKVFFDDAWTLRQRILGGHHKDNATFFKKKLADEKWYRESFDPSSVMIAD